METRRVPQDCDPKIIEAAHEIYQSMYDFAYKKGYADGEKNPSVETMLKLFWEFDKHGLIRDDLCFDPEHFMETVIKFHWNDGKEE